MRPTDDGSAVPKPFGEDVADRASELRWVEVAARAHPSGVPAEVAAVDAVALRNDCHILTPRPAPATRW
jgi:hypothetical protein